MDEDGPPKIARCAAPISVPGDLKLSELSGNCLVAFSDPWFFKVITRDMLGDVDPPELDVVNTRRMQAIDPTGEFTIPLCRVSGGTVLHNAGGKFLASPGDEGTEGLVLVSPRLDLIKVPSMAEAFTARGCAHTVSHLARLLAWFVGVSDRFGIAHNDMHPGNVLYDRAGDRLVLIDFGRTVMRDGASFTDGDADALRTVCEITGRCEMEPWNGRRKQPVTYELLVGLLEELGYGLEKPPLELAPWAGDVMRLATDLLRAVRAREGVDFRLPGSSASLAAATPGGAKVVVRLRDSPSDVVRALAEDDGSADFPTLSALPSNVRPFEPVFALGLAILSVAWSRLWRLLGLHPETDAAERGFMRRVRSRARESGVSDEALNVVLRAVAERSQKRAGGAIAPPLFELTDADDDTSCVRVLCLDSVHTFFTVEDQLACRQMLADFQTRHASVGGASVGGGVEADGGDTGVLRTLFPTSQEEALVRSGPDRERRQRRRRARRIERLSALRTAPYSVQAPYSAWHPSHAAALSAAPVAVSGGGGSVERSPDGWRAAAAAASAAAATAICASFAAALRE